MAVGATDRCLEEKVRERVVWLPPEKPSRCTGRALRVPATEANRLRATTARGRYQGGHRTEDPKTQARGAQGPRAAQAEGNRGYFPKRTLPYPLPSAPSYPRSKGLREGTRLAEPRHVPAPQLDGQSHHRRCFGGCKFPRANPGPFGWRLGSGWRAGAQDTEAQGGPGESGLR